MWPLRLIGLWGLGVAWSAGGGSVARDTASPLNGLRGYRSPGVLTKAREIVYIAKGSRGVALATLALMVAPRPSPGRRSQFVLWCQWRQTRMAVCEAINKVC